MVIVKISPEELGDPAYLEITRSMVNLNALDKGLLFLKFYCIHCFSAGPAYLRFKTSVINSYFTLILWLLESQIAELLQPIWFHFFRFISTLIFIAKCSIFTSSFIDFTFTFSMSPLYLLSSQNFTLSLTYSSVDFTFSISPSGCPKTQRRTVLTH